MKKIRNYKNNWFGNLEEKLEVQLFYINDKNSALEDILGSFKANKSVDMTSLLQCCVDSIKRSNPNVKITLVTDAATKIHKGVQGIKVIETEKISHKSLIYDLFVYRRDYIEKNIDKNLNIVFADIDVLFNCDLSF